MANSQYHNMPDRLTPEQRHRNMAAIHATSTKPEMRLRKALWNYGFRYRINDKRLPGKPDIVLPKHRTVIFVHGCFWHGHDGCRKYVVPKTNTGFWEEKIRRNKVRDQDVWRHLEAKGWNVIIVWECELEIARLKETVKTIATVILQNGNNYQAEKDERRKNRDLYKQERCLKREKESALRAEVLEKYSKRH